LAQAEVKARKARQRVFTSLAQTTPAAKQRPAVQAELPLTTTCQDCGTKIPGRPHRYCPSCGVLIPGFDPATRHRRGRAIATTRAELERWRAAHQGAVADPQEFRELILPGLAQVKLRAIMAALGLCEVHRVDDPVGAACAGPAALGGVEGAGCGLLRERRRWAAGLIESGVGSLWSL
jgi:ribosomal protein L32